MSFASFKQENRDECANVKIGRAYSGMGSSKHLSNYQSFQILMSQSHLPFLIGGIKDFKLTQGSVLRIILQDFRNE